MLTVEDYKVFDCNGVGNMPVVEVVDFPAAGEFEAFRKAEAYLQERGYIWGSMQRDSPIGFAPAEKTEYISKWRNMNTADRRSLSGVIVPCGDFREGGAKLLFFEKPRKEESLL